MEALLVPHSSAPAKMSQVKTPQLMKLPREVRDSIWDYSTEGPVHYRVPKRTLFCRNCRYFHPAHTTDTVCTQSSTPYEEDYPLFFVSKDIRRESLTRFYKSPFALELGATCPNPPYLLHTAQQCMLRDTIPFKTFYTSATIHVDMLKLLDHHDFAGFQKLRHLTIDLGKVNLVCTGGELRAQGETITLPEILYTTSTALPLFTLTPKWAPTWPTRNLYEHWKVRGMQIKIKSKVSYLEGPPVCERTLECRMVQ